MKKIYYFFLKSFLLCLILGIFSYSYIYAEQPNPTWLKKLTHDVGLDSARGARIWVVDINNDNYPDLVWGPGGISQTNRLHVLLNVPNPDKMSQVTRIFIDFTDSSGINATRDPNKLNGRVSDIVGFADLNNDGNIDAVTSIYYHRLQMYLPNNDPGDRSEVLLGDGKGHFKLKLDAGINDMIVDDTLPPGLINATGMGFLDYDYDGNIDLYISTWFTDYAAFNQAGTPMKDILLKGKGDGSFTMIKNYGGWIYAEPEYGVNITDWDNDGWQDIICSPYCRTGGNLFRNMKDGTFQNYSAYANYSSQIIGGDEKQALCQWSAQTADFDNDGDMDLLQVQVHGGYDPGEGRTHITVNKGTLGNYRLEWALDRLKRDAPPETHIGDQGGHWFDLDGDGLQDVAICQMGYPAPNTKGQERLYICQQDTNHFFNDISKAVGVYDIKEGHTPVPLDYDLDGDQDLLVSHQVRDTIKTPKDTILIYMQIEFLRNDIGNKNNWISYKLYPPAGCNKIALGARIIVYSGKNQMLQEVQGGLGHFASLQPYLRNVGLGQKNHIDSITIRWPRADLLTTTIKNPPLNVVLELNDNGIKDIFKNWDGKKPLIAFNNGVLQYGTINTGLTSNLSFEVTNPGDTALNVTDMFVENNSDNNYSITNKSVPFSLQPGEKKSFTVKFAPMYRADFNRKVTFVSNAFNRPKGAVDLEGAGFQNQPMLALSSSAISFDTLLVDSTKILPIILSNVGELPLDINGISVQSPENVFSLVGGFSQITLQPGMKDTFWVKFIPKQEMAYLGNLRINSNAYNGAFRDINLTGFGLSMKPRITLNMIALIFKNITVGQYSEKIVNVTNSGNGVLVVKDVSVPSEFTEFFSFPGLTLPILIDSGTSKPLTVRFFAKEEKAYNTVLSFVSNSVIDSVRALNIKANGVQATVEETCMANDVLSVEISPNPFSNYADINYTVKGNMRSKIELFIVDVFGRKISELVNRLHEPGDYQIQYKSNGISDGIYYLIAKSEEKLLRIPVVIVK